MTVKVNSDSATIQVYFDGLCQPCNPGGLTCYSFIIETNTAQRIHSEYGLTAHPFTDNSTNNVAEYTGIIKALEWLLENNFHDQKIIVSGDSQLVINQLRRNWKVRALTMVPLCQKTKSLISKFKDIKFEWIPRQKNGEADKLTNKAYYDALESNPSLLNLVGRYMATEDQLNLLKSSGIKTEKYLSKIEANRLLSKSRNKVT
jgi:ribonuclease HI